MSIDSVVDRTKSEREIVRACLEVLSSRGIFAWRVNVFAARIRVGTDRRERTVRSTSINGVADILGVFPGSGKLIAVECKRPGNRPSEDQQAFLDAVRRRGGLALLIYDAQDLAETVEREMSASQGRREHRCLA